MKTACKLFLRDAEVAQRGVDLLLATLQPIPDQLGLAWIGVCSFFVGGKGDTWFGQLTKERKDVVDPVVASLHVLKTSVTRLKVRLSDILLTEGGQLLRLDWECNYNWEGQRTSSTELRRAAVGQDSGFLLRALMLFSNAEEQGVIENLLRGLGAKRFRPDPRSEIAPVLQQVRTLLLKETPDPHEIVRLLQEAVRTQMRKLIPPPKQNK